MPGLALATAAILGAAVGALCQRFFGGGGAFTHSSAPVSDDRVSVALARERNIHATRTELVRSAFEDGVFTTPVEAIVVLDCDRFQLVNDAFGSGVGDLVLREVGRRIHRIASAPHQLVRTGGDEFVLLVRGLNDPDRVIELALAIVDAFDEPLEVLDRPIYTGVSAGVAVASLHGSRPGVLLAAADSGMREAKLVGRNTVRMYDADVGRRDLLQARALQRVRASFDANNLLLHYQPKLRLTDGACVGFEALLRLRTSDGVEPPEPLIEAAEQSGFIRQLGEWTFKRAALQVREWRDIGIDLPIAVNLSAQQLQDPRFLAFVETQLTPDEQLPRWLQLEITESALAFDQLKFTNGLVRLRELGFQLQIDDFGTGYSTMAFLSKMAIDTLKIDRTFIAGLPDAKDSQKIVSAMIGLAHDLDLRVVAEGIGTASQAAWLRERQCDQGQGFLFAEAMTPDDATAFARGSEERRRRWLESFATVRDVD